MATLFNWILVAIAIALVSGLLLIPALLRAEQYVVKTGSMAPVIPVNSIVVVGAVSPEDVHIGDVITFHSEDSKNTITHRVRAVAEDGALITRGDANNVDDPPVPAGNVIGRVMYHIPFLGWFAGPDGSVVRTAILALVVAVWGSAAIARIRSRSRRGH